MFGRVARFIRRAAEEIFGEILIYAVGAGVIAGVALLVGVTVPDLPVLVYPVIGTGVLIAGLIAYLSLSSWIKKRLKPDGTDT